MHRTFFIFTVFCLTISSGAAEPLKNGISVDFTKTNRSKSNVSTTRGTIYSIDNRTIIQVNQPISQYMIIDSLTTLIYNPGDSFAIQMKRKSTALLPFFQAFLGFVNGQSLAPLSSFNTKSTKKNGEELRSIWTPDETKTSFRGELEMVYKRDIHTATILRDKKGKILSEMRFSHDTLLCGHHVPLHIVTLNLQKRDTVSEVVSFKNPALVKTIPPHVQNFKLPPGFPVKVIEW